MSKKKKILKILLCFLLVLIILLLFATAYFLNNYSKMNYKERTYATLNEAEREKIALELKDGVKETSPEDKIKAAEAKILKNLQSKQTQLAYDNNVFNILLIGTDNRSGVSGARSDSNILLSINKKTQEITMTSFMRDSYVYIPECGNNRLNAAYAFGGENLLIETIEENFKIKIDRYVQVDFFAFIDVVDAIDGVDIEVSDDEMHLINKYTKEINEIEGMAEDDGLISHFGRVHLNGKNALSYARIRDVGNSDFDRTTRQRDVLDAVFKKIKNLSIVNLNSLMNNILPKLTTDLTQGECISLLLGVPEYKNYKINSNRVPYEDCYEDLYVDGMAVLGLDFNETIKKLQKDIYNINYD